VATRPTWAEVSLTTLRKNFRTVQKHVGANVTVCAVVKADAYGHGAVECSRALESEGARWLGVTVNGGQEQPRALLLSVPYALKASDAETIGGLPPSAFMLANKTLATGTSAKNAPASTPAASKNNAAPSNADITGKGTLDFIPMWDSTSDIINSLIFQKNSQIGIATIAPAATLDVNGKGDVRDTLTLFPKGTDPALAINGTTFKVDQTGKVSFVSGQSFPGAGSVASVALSAPSSDFTVSGSPVTKTGTLGLNWNVALEAGGFMVSEKIDLDIEAALVRKLAEVAA